MLRTVAIACAALAVLTLHVASAQNSPPVPGQTTLQVIGGIQAVGLFERHCSACHGAPAADSRAPNRDALRQLTPERVLAALTTGAMASVADAAGLTEAQRRALALNVSGRPLGSGAGAASVLKNRCQKPTPLGNVAAGPMWNGWSPDGGNGRFQQETAAGLTGDQVTKLRLRWAFAFPGATSMYTQPTVVDGHVFISSDAGFVYSLDAATGCVYWSFEAPAGVRTAVTVGPVKGLTGVRYAAYFGDLHNNVYGVDADTGKLLWNTRVETHAIARITGSITLSGDRLFVPVSSLEEVAAGNSLSYECCTFRGSVVALDVSTGTGRQVWKSYAITEEPIPDRKNSIGTVLWKNAGAAIWNTPTVDPKRRAVYVGTGDAYTVPAAQTANSVVALDYDTGKHLWWRQIVANDAWISGCTPTILGGPLPELRSQNCPDQAQLSIVEYDSDVTSTILRTLENGRSVLIAAGEFGDVLAVDPDRKGELVWRTHLGEPLPGQGHSGIGFGAAADDKNVYLPLERRSGGLTALKLTTGERAWHAPGPKPNCPDGVTGCSGSQHSAPTVIPGAVFSGASDGVLRAYSTVNGQILWEFNTARSFPTVNDIPGKGGSLRGPGPIVAGGMLLTGSGYAGGMAGNVLLAFAVER